MTQVELQQRLHWRGIPPRMGGGGKGWPGPILENPCLRGGDARGKGSIEVSGLAPRNASTSQSAQATPDAQGYLQPEWVGTRELLCHPIWGSLSWERPQVTLGGARHGGVGSTLLASPKSKGLRAAATPRPSTASPRREARLAHGPLGKGPAALGGGPALPQVSRGGRAEESVAGVCGAQVFEGREGFF